MNNYSIIEFICNIVIYSLAAIILFNEYFDFFYFTFILDSLIILVEKSIKLI